MQGKPTPVLYLDLDGTVRWGKDELGRFVNGPDDVRVFDGVPEMLARYKAAGWRVIGISNQGGIALGLVSLDQVEAAMTETQRQCNELFDRMAWCPHHPDASEPKDAICWCRKPAPGLVIGAALAEAVRRARDGHHESYPPYLALLVGDRPEDQACAVNTNIRFMDARVWRAGGHVLDE